MSRALELLLNKQLRTLTSVYVATFAHSYAKLASGPVDFDNELKIYEQVIEKNAESIFRSAAFGISGYCSLVGVFPRESFCQFKLIYFLGRAINAQLEEFGHAKLAQIHMFTMIGLLDEALVFKSIHKPRLTATMTRLIRFGRFWSELGHIGCYVSYKSSSTAPDDVRRSCGR